MSDRDNITLPRKVGEDVLYALISEQNHGGDDCYADSITALRTALAAEQPKPSDDRKAMKEALRILTKPESGDLRWQVSDACDILRTAIRTALAAPKQEHPGYVIGSHWLETAYSRICAGEAEADVLRDCGWERVDQALRRDAERYRWGVENARWVRHEHEAYVAIPVAVDADLSCTPMMTAAIDAAMGDKT